MKLFEEDIKRERERYLEQLKSNIQEYEEKLQEERRIYDENIQKVHERMEEYHSEAIVEKSSLENQIRDLKAEITHYEEVMKARDDTLSTKMAEIEAKTNALNHKDASMLALHEELGKAREYLAAKKQVLINYYVHAIIHVLATCMSDSYSTYHMALQLSNVWYTICVYPCFSAAHILICSLYKLISCGNSVLIYHLKWIADSQL